MWRSKDDLWELALSYLLWVLAGWTLVARLMQQVPLPAELSPWSSSSFLVFVVLRECFMLSELIRY